MIINGYIKLFRKIKTDEWYQDGNTIRLFIHCLLSANYEELKWQGEIIPIGSFVTSLNSLVAELGISKQSLRTSLNRLKSTQKITYISTHKYTIINVVNWRLYQSGVDEPNTVNNTVSNIQLTQCQHSANTNERIKELKEDKKDKELKDLNTTLVLLEKDEKGEMTPYKEIVEYLNEKTGLNLRYTTNKTRDLIKARWNEGFRLEDFKSAIDNAVKFRTKPNGEIDTRYLMPKTIFNGSFETRVLGTTYKSKSKEMEKEEQVDILKGRYDHLITRD